MGAVRNAAIALVKVQAASASRPILEDGDVALLVDAAALVDPYGVRPGQPNWAETYDTNAATALAWEAKAGKVAGDYSFSADGASYNKGDVLAHCLQMQAMYAARAGNSLGTIQVIGTNNVNTLDAIARQVIP